MNKKEVLEIRKQFTPANCAITRIAGCYVDHEKNKKMETGNRRCRSDRTYRQPVCRMWRDTGIFNETKSQQAGR